LSDFNETTENAIRLSAYKAAIDADVSPDKAAAIAKNLTVNFNKKGQVASQLGALYAFFNANAQGTARIAQTLNGPAGKKIIAGGLLVGVLQAVMMAAAGYDDDEPPQFTRERNFVIPVGDRYLSVPYALGYHVIPNTGRLLMEIVLSGGKHAGDKVFDLMAAFLEAFNPMGSGKSVSEVLSPTITDPIVALERNTDAFGRPIAKEDMSGLNPTPGFTRSKDTASLFGKWLSEVINTLTGGDDYKPGKVSPTPDQIDYLIGQATGGVGREALKAQQAIGSAVTGEDLPPYKIPLLGRFYGNAKSGAAERDRFYRNVTDLNVTKNEIKGLQHEKKMAEVKQFKASHPESKLVGKADDVERRISALKARKRFLQKKGDSKDEIKKVDDRISFLMKDFNEQVKKVAK
jgi:Large polyvalent protein associated domain 38